MRRQQNGCAAVGFGVLAALFGMWPFIAVTSLLAQMAVEPGTALTVGSRPDVITANLLMLSTALAFACVSYRGLDGRPFARWAWLSVGMAIVTLAIVWTLAPSYFMLY
jgi:hypothetical protein